jgi:hypothetical protein
MTKLRERDVTATRPPPDEADLSGPPHRDGRVPATLRTMGAIAVLVVGAVHLQQYLTGYDAISIIGPLFVLNFAGAAAIGLGLLVPVARLQPLHGLLAVGGIGLAATSIVFLFISEHHSLFGFHEYGYRAAIVIALAAEAISVVTLAAYLAARRRRRP